MRCNGELHEAPRADVADEVPPRSFAAFRRFFRCAECGRVYWLGSHWQRIARALRAAAAAAGVDASALDALRDEEA